MHFEQHDDRYARTREWLDVVKNVWKQDHFSYDGKYYQVADNVLQPKPAKTPFLYAGGESEAAKDLISSQCDGYVMHGDSPEQIGARIADMRRRREQKGLPPMKFGVAGYTIVRDNDQDVKKELDRITNVKASAAGYGNYQQWLAGTQARAASIAARLFGIEPRPAYRPHRHARPDSGPHRRVRAGRGGLLSAAGQPAARGNGAVLGSRHSSISLTLEERASARSIPERRCGRKNSFPSA
ncbi:LLM class flavin-dependent oxidoreductase [Hymenobacter humi]|uniref:LLM class flavin-dependent oxidoreductase n=1 Tax=Hymenobacter humi TaxID=1411620 RepID=A0ABW2U8A3_9BACT